MSTPLFGLFLRYVIKFSMDELSIFLISIYGELLELFVLFLLFVELVVDEVDGVNEEGFGLVLRLTFPLPLPMPVCLPAVLPAVITDKTGLTLFEEFPFPCARLDRPTLLEELLFPPTLLVLETDDDDTGRAEEVSSSDLRISSCNCFSNWALSKSKRGLSSMDELFLNAANEVPGAALKSKPSSPLHVSTVKFSD